MFNRMPYLDFFLLIITSLICFYGSFIIYQKSNNSPIPTYYFLLSLSLLSLGLNFFLIIPIFVYEFGIFQPFFEMNFTQTQAITILRVAHFCALIFVLSFTILTYIPSIKVSLKPLAVLIFSTMFCTATYIVDAFTIMYKITGDKFSISYALPGQFFLILSLTIFIYVLSIRYHEIQLYLKSTSKELKPFTNTKARSRFYILIVLIILTFILGRYIDIPTYTWAGLSSIGVLYLVYAFKKNPAFYFISNARLEAVIVLNSLSGKVQYYKNFQEVDMLITGVMTAFNISLKSLISSQTDIQQVFFEDKALLLKKGSYTTTIVFVSQKSVITDSITNFLSKEFETQFYQILSSHLYGVDDLSIFSSFNGKIDLIKNFYTIG